METKRQCQKRLTRARLMATAFKLFSENGILNTSTSLIAKEAQVAHGTVFSHFPTQEQLITAVIEDFGTKIAARLDSVLNSNYSLFKLLRLHLNCLIEFEPFYTKLIVERQMLPISARNTYIMIQANISFHIELAAKREIESGTIKNEPVHLIFNTWISLVHYYLSNSDLFTENSSVLKEHGDELLNHYINLIKI